MSTERVTGDFGKMLREARERKGVTLRQIANATKLSVAQLEALEKNDVAKLPGGIFSRGIVRSYATQVGLDPEKAIQDFIAHFSHNEAIVAGHPTSEQNEDNEAFESDRQMTSTFLWLIGASVAVAAGVLYFSTVGRRPTAEAVSLAARAADSQPAPPPVATAATETPSAAAPGAASEIVPPPAPPADVPAPAVATDDRLTVALSVTRPCFVSASVDGQRVIERLLPAGTQQTLDGKRELVLTARAAGASAGTPHGV